ADMKGHVETWHAHVQRPDRPGFNLPRQIPAPATVRSTGCIRGRGTRPLVPKDSFSNVNRANSGTPAIGQCRSLGGSAALRIVTPTIATVCTYVARAHSATFPRAISAWAARSRAHHRGQWAPDRAMHGVAPAARRGPARRRARVPACQATDPRRKLA